MEQYYVRQAAPEQADVAICLLEKRVAWMEEKGIRQWTLKGYLRVFPKSYFQEMARQGCLYLSCNQAGDPVGVIVFQDSDPHWEHDGMALYAHNLITDPAAPGAGEELLRFGEELAATRGKRYVRLDCVPHNEKLNAYYENHGYILVGTIDEVGYKGNKRQKTVG